MTGPLRNRLATVRRVPTDVDREELTLTIASTNLPLVGARTCFLVNVLGRTGMVCVLLH